MKRNLITKSATLAALTLLLFGINTAMANIPEETAAETAQAIINQFEVVAMELPEIHTDATAAPRLLSSDTLENILTEKAEFRKESQPLVHALKAKWAALSDALTREALEGTTAARLQNEISVLNARLTEMRLDHLMALKEIKAEAIG